jgi:predicted HTH transcriptional regulator
MVDEIPWEDCLLERKVENDLKDLLKTLVAFSNSVRPGHTATILIGEKDDGTVQGVRKSGQYPKDGPRGV